MTLLVVAVIFGVVNAVIWPVVFWLTLSFTLATLGLFVVVVNALMFMLTSRIAGMADDDHALALDGVTIISSGVKTGRVGHARDERCNHERGPRG